MGGVYARADGEPEEVWKAVYYHYLPISVEADAPPLKAQLGKAVETWAAVSLADKLDTLVGLFASGEKPTGSRDPYGLRRAAHGIFKILVDLPALSGRPLRPRLHPLLKKAAALLDKPLEGWADEQLTNLYIFLRERLEFVLGGRGIDVRAVRAVVNSGQFPYEIRPADALENLKDLSEFIASPDFRELASTFKRAKNIIRDMSPVFINSSVSIEFFSGLTEPAEKALLAEIVARSPVFSKAVTEGKGFRAAYAEAARFKPAVSRFFDDVLVMAPDPIVRERRLVLLWEFVRLILPLADISEIVAEEKQA